MGWLRADDQTILSLNKKVVTHNPRVTVQHESRTWNLHIRQIRESDRGCYMCQINTAQMKKQLGCIEGNPSLFNPDMIEPPATVRVSCEVPRNRSKVECQSKKIVVVVENQFHKSTQFHVNLKPTE